MSRHANRGQALVETALALPCVIIALMLLFWVVRYAVISERLETGVRYADQILSERNIYTAFSLYSLYDATSSTPQLMLVCSTPPPAYISSTSAFTDNNIEFNGAGMWAGSSTQSACKLDHQSLHNVGLSRDYVLGFDSSSMSTVLTAPFKSQTLFPAGAKDITLRSQSISYFHADSIGDLVDCFPSMGQAISASLHPQAGAPQFVINGSTFTQHPPVSAPTIDPNSSCANPSSPPANVSTVPGTPIPQASSDLTPGPF